MLIQYLQSFVQSNHYTIFATLITLMKLHVCSSMKCMAYIVIKQQCTFMIKKWQLMHVPEDIQILTKWSISWNIYKL